TSPLSAGKIEVELGEFVRFFTDPVSWFFRDRHRTSLRLEDYAVNDEELMSFEGGIASWDMKQSLLELATQLSPENLPAEQRVEKVVAALERQYRASARWPIGAVGEQARRKLLEEVNAEWLDARDQY